MRKLIVAGNWKMNTSLSEGVALAKDVAAIVAEKGTGKAQVIIGVPFTHLSEVKKVKGDGVLLASQNCAAEKAGAYTGEVSAAMLASLGVDAVILGHSERRAYYGETDATLIEKVARCFENNLTPIFCCGEVLEERNGGTYLEVVKSQIANVLFQLSAADFAKVVIAYEPVWAIGTGVVATPAQAQDMHAYIRGLIAEKFGAQVADDTTLLYGGSCNDANAQELFANPDVDGGLIGGASLKAASFLTIVHSF
jgi:triosephosphate isomerase